MTRDDIIAKLAELNLTLPEAPKPVAVYVPSVVVDGWIVVSGQLPMRAGKLVASGVVGHGGVGVELAQEAARQCAINAIAAIGQALDGDFDRLERLVKLEVFVASAPGFCSHHLVANGASELMGHVFGPQGVHARAAVGVPSLPLGAAVEVAVLAKIRP